MSDDIKIIKKEIKDFLLINFSLIAFISIFLFFSLSKTNGIYFAENFSKLFMYIPAFSTIVILKKISNYEFNPEIEKFFKIFSIVALVRIAVTIGETFLLNSVWISSTIDTLTAAYFLYFVLLNSYEMKDINLCLGKNSKEIAFVILLFIIIIIGSIILDSIFGKVPLYINGENIATVIMSMITNFLLGFSFFFGEEFGWRYFLQPRLQKLYGKRLGVIALGFIWGIWHAPLCFTLYSPTTPIYCVIAHLSTCIFLGIYLGYAYMKTKNLWTPILMHMIYNSIIGILRGGYMTEFTLEMILYFILTYAIYFMPFLLAKEYRANQEIEA